MRLNLMIIQTSKLEGNVAKKRHKNKEMSDK